MRDPSLQPIVAIIGHPVAGNPAQFMFEKTFSHHDLDWRFLSLDVAPDDLTKAIDGMRTLGFDGGCFAPPFPHRAMPMLDEADFPSPLVRIVDGFVRREDRLVGFHAESQAVADLLNRQTPLAGRTALVVGHGRSAHAIAARLAHAQVERLLLVDQDRPKDASEFLEHLDESFDDASVLSMPELATALPNLGKFLTGQAALLTVPGDVDFVVRVDNASNEDDGISGLTEYPFDWSEASNSLVLADTSVGWPPPFVAKQWRGTERGFITGLDVLVEQAIVTFSHWTGFEPDPTIARDAVEEFLEL